MQNANAGRSVDAMLTSDYDSLHEHFTDWQNIDYHAAHARAGAHVLT